VPDRILRQGLRTSEAVNSLSDFAFRLYALLLTIHDDFGRFDARPELLRVELFPFRIDRVRGADVARGLAECREAGTIALFGPESKPTGVVLKTDKPRALKSKLLEPPAGVECWRTTGRPSPHHAVLTGEYLGEAARTCAQMRADADTCGQTRPYAESYAPSEALSPPVPPPPSEEGESVEIGAEEGPPQPTASAHAPRFTPMQVQALFNAYPRREGPGKALPAIRHALLALADRPDAQPDPAAWLMAKVRAFAESPAGKAGRFCPKPENWFADGRYDDDPAAWLRAEGPPPKSAEAQRRAMSETRRQSEETSAAYQQKLQAEIDRRKSAGQPIVMGEILRMVTV
jgi:hypothetical protein